jgi:MOSC domain-containing protein YiiM
LIQLVSVNVGLPAVIGTRRGKPVMSGIRKSPVTAETVTVGLTNLDGDRQADLRVHGGPEKAIFAYPLTHLAAWTEELQPDTPFQPGSIGDNLTIANLDETQVSIGDVWRWGDALIQICQPRYPCFKLAMAAGTPRIVKRFLATGHSGWYIRVLEPGDAPVCGPITVQQRDPAGITVRQAALAVFGETPAERQLEIPAHPALAASWRTMLERRASERL